jgi:D-aminopeptidase
MKVLISADMEGVCGVERAGERTVAFVAADTLAFNDTFRALMKASAVTFSP